MSVLVASGLVTRTWHGAAGGRTVLIKLTHDTLTNDRSLAIDNATLPGSVGLGPATLPFSVEGAQGAVTIARSGFSYTCVW